MAECSKMSFWSGRSQLVTHALTLSPRGSSHASSPLALLTSQPGGPRSVEGQMGQGGSHRLPITNQATGEQPSEAL